MKNKTKTIFWGFFSLDYKAMEMYLEEMAKKGWMLKKIGRITAKFVPIEPQSIKFCVDVFKFGGPFISENSREVKSYRRKCEELGWNFIASKDYLQFFYANEGNNPIPIQIDEVEEQKNVKSTLLKNELLSIIIILTSLYMVVSRSFPLKYTNLLTYIGVLGTFLYPILVIPMLILLFYNLGWMLKSNRNIKKGLPMERPTLKNAKIRAKIFNSLTITLILIFIIAIIVDSLLTPNKTLFALFAPITGIGTGLIIRYFIKKKAKNKGDSIFYIIVGVVSALIIVNIAAPLIIRNAMNNTNYKVTVPEGYPIVTIKDITKEANEVILESREFNPGSSPIVPKHYDYWETWDINGTRQSIRGSYYESNHPYFIKIIFNGKAEEVARMLNWKNKSLIKDEEMKHLWSADNLLLSEDRDIIIIQKGNKVVSLSGDIDFDQAYTRERIIEKLFN